jgi:polyadenylate-binding protein
MASAEESGAASSSGPSSSEGFKSSSLYVGDLANDITEQALFEIFQQAGPITSIRVCRDALTRRSLGYAYVNFQSAEDAGKALDQFNSMEVSGRPLRVSFSKRDPSLRKSGVGNIFIKNLAAEIDQKALYDTFAQFGKIVSCKLVTDAEGKSKGHGYVQYEDDAAAQSAIDTVDGKELAGQQVSVSPFRRKEERGTSSNTFTNLYIKNLAESVTDDLLKEVFGAIGQLSSAVVMRDEEGKSKGFGFVNYESPEHAAEAVEQLNGHRHDDKEWEVSRAQKKSEREAELKAKYEREKKEKQEKLADSNLYIKNLDDSQTDDSLRQLFEEFGTIISSKVLRDPNTGVSRGVGFVQLSTPEEATRAISELNSKMINGKPLYVAIAQKKQDRQRRLKGYFQQPQGPYVPQHPMNPMAGQFYGAPGMAGPMGYYQGPYQAGMGGQFGGMPGMMPGQMRPPQYGGMPGFYGMPGAYGMPMQPYAANGRGFRGGRAGFQGARGMGRGPMGRGPGRGGRTDQFGYNSYPAGPHPAQPPQQQAQSQQQPVQPQQLQHRPVPQHPGAHVQMNGGSVSNSAAHAISNLPASLPGQAAALPLQQRLAGMDNPEERRQTLGEELYPRVMEQEPELAAKITGMLLECSEADILALLEEPADCHEKIAEAKRVLVTSGHVNEPNMMADQMAGLSVS